MARLTGWNPPKIDSQSALWQWGGASAPYSPFVYHGGRTESGATIPGRAWDKSALSQIVLVKEFKANVRHLNALRESFVATAEAFDQELDDAFLDERWPWPRRTRRRNRTTVGSPRDIVDTGALLRSKNFQIRR